MDPGKGSGDMGARCSDVRGQVPDQEVEEDDEMLDYSKLSQSRPSYVIANNLQNAVNRSSSN